MKEREKIGKYWDLARELKKTPNKTMEHGSCGDTNYS